MRITTISLLTILYLALSTPTFAQQIYNDGSIDGNDNAFFVTGPNLPNFLGSVMDISNGFVAAASGTPTSSSSVCGQSARRRVLAMSWALRRSAPNSAAEPLGKMLVTAPCYLPTASVMAFTTLMFQYLRRSLPTVTHTGSPSAMPPTAPAMVHKGGTSRTPVWAVLRLATSGSLEPTLVTADSAANPSRSTTTRTARLLSPAALCCSVLASSAWLAYCAAS